jgi:hypothetical protein
MLIRIIGAFTSILCGYACYWAARWAFADYIATKPSRSRIEFALRLAPGNPEYYIRLAQAEPALALSRMQRAADLNPLSAPVWIELARAAEEHNNFPGAEHSLLRAVQVDKTFAPRWLLAQYYSRRHDEARFWPAARAALATSYDDVTPLFDLCWNFAPEPRIILDRAVPNRPDVLRQYFDFLLAKNRLDAANGIANQVMRDAGPDTVPSLLSYCDRLLAKNDSSRAVEAWNALATKQLLKYPALAVAQGRSLTNGGFEPPEEPSMARGFDWRVTAVDGVFVQYGGASGLRFDFSGKQPESCELLTEWVPVEPARAYRFVVRYATDGLDRDTGLKWRVLDVTTGADLLSTGGWLTGNQGREAQERYGFSTPAETRLVKLVLAYQRLPGTVRIEGRLSLGNAALGFGP